MKMKQLILGYMENNCYIKASADGKIVYIIDPATEAEKIIECVEHHFEFEKAVILLTHAHADHIGAVKEISEHFLIDEIMLKSEDIDLYESQANCIPPWFPLQKNLPKTVEVHDTDDFQVIMTPGHTRGGVCYYFQQDNELFSGDTLFYRSVGRTDLPGGDWNTLHKSIREKLFTLPQETIVYPGHGESSTIGEEIKYNPYV